MRLYFDPHRKMTPGQNNGNYAIEKQPPPPLWILFYAKRSYWKWFICITYLWAWWITKYQGQILIFISQVKNKVEKVKKKKMFIRQVLKLAKKKKKKKNWLSMLTIYTQGNNAHSCLRCRLCPCLARFHLTEGSPCIISITMINVDKL